MHLESEISSVEKDYSDENQNLEIRKWFYTVDTNRSGKINTNELQAALINAQGKCFSEEACRLMINLFDSDRNGTIDINEFYHLYTYVVQWVDVFRAYDKDSSGYIEENELLQALNQMGYRLSLVCVKILLDCVGRSNQLKRMSLDEFIVTCIKIQRLTSAFRLRDIDMKGVISITFENFIELILKEFL